MTTLITLINPTNPQVQTPLLHPDLILRKTTQQFISSPTKDVQYVKKYGKSTLLHKPSNMQVRQTAPALSVLRFSHPSPNNPLTYPN